MLPNLSGISTLRIPSAPTKAIEPKIYDYENLTNIRSGFFEVQKVPNDGNCFYHAMAVAAYYNNHPQATLYYNPATGYARADIFRRDVANFLEKEWDAMAEYHPELKRVAKENFIRGVRTNKWAGEPEVDAAVNLLGGVKVALWTDIAPTTPGAAPRRVLHSLAKPDTPQGGPNQSLKTYHILMNGDHFDWLRPRDESPASSDYASSKPKQFERLPRRSSRPPAPTDPNQLVRDLAQARIDRQGRRAANDASLKPPTKDPPPPRRVERQNQDRLEDMDLETQKIIDHLIALEAQDQEHLLAAQRLAQSIKATRNINTDNDEIQM